MLRKALLMVGLTMVLALTGAWAGLADEQPYVEIWTDRGTESVYRVGERIDVFIRPEYDCFVIVYEIDTDGYLRLLFPYDGRDDGFLEGGQVYRLGRGGWSRYYVTGPSGVEYIHVLASFKPFRPLYWHGQAGYEDYAYDVTWRGFGDYWGCALPPRVHGDPYIAMQSINEFICYDALEAGYAFADYTFFYVDERVHHPRYLCYDCHGYRPAFDPYASVCAGFRISFVVGDPCYNPCSWWWWCTPARIYCGPRYVCYRNPCGCGGGCGNVCWKSCGSACKKNPCGTYPSAYKWKSRYEEYCDAGCGSADHGTSYGEYYKERVRPGRGSSGKGADDDVRVKSRSKNEERYLYSRNEARAPVKHSEADANRRDGSRADAARPDGSREGEARVKQMPARGSEAIRRAERSADRPAEKPEDRPVEKRLERRVEKEKSRDTSPVARLVNALKIFDRGASKSRSSSEKSGSSRGESRISGSKSAKSSKSDSKESESRVVSEKRSTAAKATSTKSDNSKSSKASNAKTRETSNSKVSTSSNTKSSKVAPKVRTSNQGRSPSKRRSISR